MDEVEQLDHLRAAAARAGLPSIDVCLPVDRHIIANGMRIHALEWGTAGAPPIVFLHGGSLTAHTWDLVCLSLSDRFRCIAVDLRGHGESEWPADADYTFAAMSDDVAAVIDSLSLDRPVIVGMSLGGLVGLHLAATAGDRLRGLTIVDVGPDLRLDSAREILSFTDTDYEMDTVDDFVDRVVRVSTRHQREHLRRSVLYNLRQLPSGRWAWKWDKRRMLSRDLDDMKVAHARLWDCAAAVTCPTLLVRGDRSRVFLEEDGYRLAAAIPNSSLVVVADAGHAVQSDNPRGLLEPLDPFVSRCLAGVAR